MSQKCKFNRLSLSSIYSDKSDKDKDALKSVVDFCNQLPKIPTSIVDKDHDSGHGYAVRDYCRHFRQNCTILSLMAEQPF